jgi:hypothetical protein
LYNISRRERRGVEPAISTQESKVKRIGFGGSPAPIFHEYFVPSHNFSNNRRQQRVRNGVELNYATGNLRATGDNSVVGRRLWLQRAALFARDSINRIRGAVMGTGIRPFQAPFMTNHPD